MRVQCAKCHHHPYENISQADYHSLRAFFARVGKKSSWEFGIQGGEFVIYVNDTGEVGHPRTGAILPPKPLGAPPADDKVFDAPVRANVDAVAAGLAKRSAILRERVEREQLTIIPAVYELASGVVTFWDFSSPAATSRETPRAHQHH